MYGRSSSGWRAVAIQSGLWALQNHLVREVLRRHAAPSDHCEIAYESLARDPEATLQRVCATIGCDFEAGMIEGFRTDDILEGRGGADTLIGGKGDDTLVIEVPARALGRRGVVVADEVLPDHEEPKVGVRVRIEHHLAEDLGSSLTAEVRHQDHDPRDLAVLVEGLAERIERSPSAGPRFRSRMAGRGYWA